MRPIYWMLYYYKCFVAVLLTIVCIQFYIIYDKHTNTPRAPNTKHTNTPRAPNTKRLRANTKRHITYIHVGKTAGISLRKAFEQSPFDVHEYHMLFAKRRICTQHRKKLDPTVVISARHPVDRLVSAYYYTHPKNCNMRDSGTCNTRHCVSHLRCYAPLCENNQCPQHSELPWKQKMIDELKFETRFYDCFPTLHDLFNVSSECQDVFHRIFVKGTFPLRHLTRGYEFYLRDCDLEDVYVIRQEHYAKDLDCLGKTLDTEFRYVRKNTKYKAFYSPLTSEQRQKVQEFPQIKREIQLYESLLSKNKLHC